MESVASAWKNHPQSSEIYEKLSKYMELSKVREFLSGSLQAIWIRANQRIVDRCEEVLKEYGIVRGVILPTKEIYFEKNESVNYIAHDYRPGAYYNVNNYNPYWWNMPGNGKQYTTCGHLWEGEYEGCINLPGHALGERAGQYYLRRKSASCWRFECPICYQKSLAREAFNIAKRFSRMPKYDPILDKHYGQTADLYGNLKDLDKIPRREYVETPEGRTKFGVPLHIMLSPGEEDNKKIGTSQGFEEVRLKLHEIIKFLDIAGGCILFHPWRGDKETEPIDPAGAMINILNGDFDIKGIKAYFESQGKESPQMWYTSAHFHIIGYAKQGLDGNKVSELYEETGWVSVNLGVRKSVMSTALYQLSHAGVHKKFHTVSWFGVMSRKSRWFKENAAPEEEEHKKPICPECGEELKKYVYEGSDEAPLKDEPEGAYWINAFPGLREVETLHADRTIKEDTSLDDWEYSFYTYVDQAKT